MTKLQLTTFEEQIFFNTVLIERRKNGKSKYWTGFLVAETISPGRDRILLVSNKHVFWGKNNTEKEKNITFTLHKEDTGTDGSYNLWNKKEFNIQLTRNDPNYRESSIEDVAAYDISNYYNGDFKSWMRSLKISDFLSYEYSAVHCWKEVSFVWYPSGYFDRKNFLPIMRKGTISSIPSVDFNWEKKILIDAQVFPGSSGSPVFVSIDWKYRLLGIITSALFRDMDSMPRLILSDEDNWESKDDIMVECLGIGLVIKKEIIQEVYDLF